MMPNMDGFEVCRRFKSDILLQDVPIIFISALSDTNDIVKAFTNGGADYITKPFKAEEVKARVSTHLKIYFQNNELKKLNADKDRFITILAHDLKSPFSSVLGFSELLANNIRIYDMDQLEEFANILYNSSKNFFNLLEELLLWARAETGKIIFEPQIVSLNDLYIDVIDVLVLSAKKKNITVKHYIDPSTFVFVDKNMVKTILRNLLYNAIKFTHELGTIIVSTEVVSNAELIVSVLDSGVGISSKRLDSLFDFTQILSTEGTANETGTGFGLLLCKEFVEKHGGRIWVDSEVGKGTNFHFTLPLHSH
jgi:signal transduction histidine kinase